MIDYSIRQTVFREGMEQGWKIHDLFVCFMEDGQIQRKLRKFVPSIGVAVRTLT